MTVEIIVYTDRLCTWFVTLGGIEISRDYTTRRACVRGLWRWWWKAQNETVGLHWSWGHHVKLMIHDAIRESRGK